MINVNEINKIRNFMQFFEYADYLQSSGIQERKLLAPSYDDLSGTRARISKLILKGLRSPGYFNEGVELSNRDKGTSLKILSVKRSRTSAQDLSSYYSFAIEFDMKYQREVPEGEAAEDSVHIPSPVAKRKIFNALFGEEASRSPQEQALHNKLFNDFELCAIDEETLTRRLDFGTRSRGVSRELHQNIRTALSGQGQMMSLDSVNTTSEAAQRIFSQYYLSSRSTIDFKRLVLKMTGGDSGTWDEILTTGAPYYNHAGNYRLFQGDLSSLMSIEDNIFIPITLQNRSTIAVHAICFLKKHVDETTGEKTLFPFVRRATNRVAIQYNDEIIIDPARFFEANSRIMRGLRSLAAC